MPTIHIQIDTLFASESFICTMFALVLFILAQRFGDLRGPKLLALAFLASGFGTLVLLVSGHLPLAIGVLVANMALMAANLLFYTGVDELLHIKPRIYYPAAIACLTLLPLVWYTFVDSRFAVRIVLLCVMDCLMQVWLLLDLLRSKNKGIAVRLLAISVALSMITDVLRALAVSQPSARILNHPTAQVAYMITGVLAACGLGIFSLMLVTGEIMDAIEHSARRDPLTGVLNRRGIEELLKGELDRAGRAQTPLAIALIDLDNFKTINDTWGHPAGDVILCEISNSITANLRSYDVCGRIGGDEFMIMLPGSTSAAAAHICGRILQHVKALKPSIKVNFSPTVSIGFTEYDLSDTIESIVARADRALYASKREGRNRVTENVAPFRMPPQGRPTAASSAARKDAPPLPPMSPLRNSPPIRVDRRPGRLAV